MMAAALLPAALGYSASQVAASPIKHHVQPAVADPDLRSWTSFLEKGPSAWIHVKNDPPISGSVIAAFKHGLAKPDPLSSVWTRFLLFRYELHPVRFAHYHPRITPELRELEQNINPPPPPPPPPPVPEPGALSISVVLVGAGLLWGWKSQRQPVE
jgi:hypothetical protein